MIANRVFEGLYTLLEAIARVLDRVLNKIASGLDAAEQAFIKRGWASPTDEPVDMDDFLRDLGLAGNAQVFFFEHSPEPEVMSGDPVCVDAYAYGDPLLFPEDGRD